ncbi:hypothetical protein H0H81_000595 [Sphagnurus paluster]|uniref:Uncharacterized protein n=1 Tax=Sphagnurus paluster TaxID=117069 RepID=A0A9P7K1W7_9AGAR|nr:hypothetical protein H0H81_000595 [Sphagnurus paluster]
MHHFINTTRLGDALWQCFSTSYNAPISPTDPSWKSAKYEVWYRDPEVVIKNMLKNPDFHGQFDYMPYICRTKAGERTWSDFMSGNYAWNHANTIIKENPENKGAMYCPIILGSHKTTVSVATGHVEYHPVYLSIGNVHNTSFTFDFPQADIYEMLSPDILHQLIKRTFKDHLVDWVGQYLVLEHGETVGNEILDEIDRRIAAAPAFPQLQRFPHGQRFKQWKGDDSKALMKVYIAAIAGRVPDAMVQSISSFMDACYIAHCDDLNEKSIKELEAAVAHFHHFRKIRNFGAPNGLCSSITESHHITVIKKPWHCSNRYEALGQMLLTNQRLDKLAASRIDFISRGNIVLAQTQESPCCYPPATEDLATTIGQPKLAELVHQFLFDQINTDDTITSNTIPLDACPEFNGPIRVYHSAVATFYHTGR